MAFNFGAFVGGLSTGIVKGIEDEEERKFKFDLMAEEEATRMRLARSSERRAQRAKDKELAGKLKARGFDQGRISFIMAQGGGYAEEMLEYASAALTNGYDPNTILKYTKNVEDMKSFIGPAGDRKLDFTQETLANLDYTTAFEQDADTILTLSRPEPDSFDTLKKMRASVVNKLRDMEAGTPEYLDLAEQNEFLLSEIKKEADALREPGEPTPDIMSNADAIRDMKFFKDTVANTYNLTSLEGTFQDVTAGAQGKSQVARIDAALAFEDRINNVGGSQNGQGVVDAELASAVGALRNIAMQTAEANVLDKTGEAGADADLATKFKMPEGKDSYSLGEIAQMDSAKPRGISYGDVVVIGGKIAIYTGMAHTYGNASSTENPLVLPYVFANQSSDPMWMVTKTGR